MSLAKVIEVIGEGESMEKAVHNAVSEASKTIHSIRSIYVEHIQAVVENQKVTTFRVNAKITFVLDKQ